MVAALKAWLANRQGQLKGGYQRKDLLLPDGTELRIRYRGAYHYARIDGDQLKSAGEVVSPRDWALMVTGSVRNPWRDIWLRRGVSESWTRASAWRNAAPYVPGRATTDRRRQSRRITD
ncbi:MAG: hypothetical protein V4693_10345 [Pseudomonadota bacterium]